MTLDRVAQRYGVRPSALASGSAEDLALDCLAAFIGASDSMEKAGKHVQAVVVVG